jgi:hypothetical protein
MALVQKATSARWAELTKAQFVPSYVEGRPEMALKKWCAYARSFKDNTSFSQEQLLKRPELRYSQEYSNIRQRAVKEPSSDIPDHLIRSLALKFRVKVVDLPEAEAAVSSREQRASARRQSDGDDGEEDTGNEDISAAGGESSGGTSGSTGMAGASGRGGAPRATLLLTQRLPGPAAASAPSGKAVARGRLGKAKMPADNGAAAKTSKKSKTAAASQEEAGDEEGPVDVSVEVIEEWMLKRLPSLVKNDNANVDDPDRELRGVIVSSVDEAFTDLSYILALDNVRARFEHNHSRWP